AQASKVAGDLRDSAAGAALEGLLADPSPRVRSLAATALGKVGHRQAVAALMRVLRENADADPFLRHAAVFGLAGCAEAPALATLATNPDRSVRLGALLALRRLGSPEVARFLSDSDPLIVTEAARAAYEAPI